MEIKETVTQTEPALAHKRGPSAVVGLAQLFLDKRHFDIIFTIQLFYDVNIPASIHSAP